MDENGHFPMAGRRRTHSSEEALTMNFFSLLSFIRPGQRPLRKRRPTSQTSSNPSAHPGLEALEDRCLLSCNTISGFVFNDANNNGLFDPGEHPIANNPIELRNANNVVVGRAITNANGYYAFSTDSTISTTPRTQSFGVDFPENKTNQSQTGTIPKFDPNLGTLTSIDLVVNGQITSDVQVENEDPSPVTVTGIVSGNLNLSGLDFNTLVTTSATSRNFNASRWDGVNDFAGTSGKDFGNLTVPGSRTVTLTSPSALADYAGAGSVAITESAVATSTATGGGNLLVKVSSTGSAHLSVVYHYIPNNCLRPGNYTIVQPVEPPGFINGKDSRNGVVLPPGPLPDSIPVTLVKADLPNNDFGERLPTADLSITKTGNPNPVVTKGTLTYTLTVANAGPVTANQVTVHDTLPPGVTFVSAAGSGWSLIRGAGSLTATLPAMAVGASSVLTIVVKAPATPGTITNTATVTSNTPDNNLSNNTAQATNQVVAPNIVVSPVIFPPTSSSFPGPGNLDFLSKLDFLAVGGPASIDPTLRAQATFVDGLYRTILNRPSDIGGLVSWVRLLRSGGTPGQVVNALWASAEHRGLQVDAYYQAFFGHAPDPAGRAYWVSVFNSGANEMDVVQMLVSSPGYQALHPDNASFVTALYNDLLARPVDATALTFWTQQLQNGVSRSTVISSILHSGESYLRVIDTGYANILHRGADPGGRSSWLSAFQTGQVNVGTFSEDLLASPEFYNLAVQASRA
jgi:uncharacterized repeat protein (TIGR01451 family)